MGKIPRYALFLGCLIPYRLQQMEAAARRVLEIFDIELAEMLEAGCCPEPVGVQGLDQRTWLALAARNLCIAEEMGLDILTLCNGCFETLKMANESLKADASLKEDTNKLLNEAGRRFKGEIEVKHLVEVLYNEVGPGRIVENVEKSLKSLRVAVHYGCHLLRPSDLLRFDDPERPSSLDELIDATGAESIPYVGKMLCCGSGLRFVESEASLGLVRKKLSSIKKARADCVVVVCPFCWIQYDLSQPLLRRTFNETYELPVLYYPELLGLAMGWDPEDMGLRFHRVSVEPILKKIL